MARHRGGLEVLLALGFVERRSVEDDELCLVLEEPPLELDLDAWSAWSETRPLTRDRDRWRNARPKPRTTHVMSSTPTPTPTNQV